MKILKLKSAGVTIFVSGTKFAVVNNKDVTTHKETVTVTDKAGRTKTKEKTVHDIVPTRQIGAEFIEKFGTDENALARAIVRTLRPALKKDRKSTISVEYSIVGFSKKPTEIPVVGKTDIATDTETPRGYELKVTSNDENRLGTLINTIRSSGWRIVSVKETKVSNVNNTKRRATIAERIAIIEA